MSEQPSPREIPLDPVVFRRLALAKEDGKSGRVHTPPLFSNPKVTVVLPAINQESNLPYVLLRVPAWVHEIVLVAGDSAGDTISEARDLRPGIRVVSQSGPGKGNALHAGLAAASGDIIVIVDADGSMDAYQMSAHVGALLAGADFVKGSRFIQGGGASHMPLYRRLGNWGLVKLVQLLFGGRYSDLCYGYCAFWKRVMPQLPVDGYNLEIGTVMNVRALKAGLNIAEVPCFQSRRIHDTGYSRAFSDGWRVFKTILRERARTSRQPNRHRPVEVDEIPLSQEGR